MGIFGKKKNVDERTALDRYFDEGEVWETQLLRRANRRMKTAVMFSVASFVIMATMAGAMWFYLPLKQLEPVVIVADRTTGFMEVSRPLSEAKSLQGDEAITMANIVRYVRARETYDIHDLESDFHIAKVMSAGKVARDLEAIYATHNVDNPIRKYGDDTTISTYIKSVQFPNNSTAVVRFSTDTVSRKGSVTDHYTSIVRFAYTGEPLKNEWRFDNPLGFQVVDYRRDQEVVRTDELAAIR